MKGSMNKKDIVMVCKMILQYLSSISEEKWKQYEFFRRKNMKPSRSEVLELFMQRQTIILRVLRCSQNMADYPSLLHTVFSILYFSPPCRLQGRKITVFCKYKFCMCTQIEARARASVATT